MIVKSEQRTALPGKPPGALWAAARPPGPSTSMRGAHGQWRMRAVLLPLPARELCGALSLGEGLGVGTGLREQCTGEGSDLRGMPRARLGQGVAVHVCLCA